MIEVQYKDKILKFPDGTPEREMLDAINNFEVQQTVPDISEDPKKVSKNLDENLEDSYIQGKLKQGVGSGVAFLQTAFETGYDTLSKGYGGQTWTEFGTEWGKNYEENQRNQVDFLSDLFGWDKPDLELLPKDEVERIIGAGAEMSTDPLVLVSKSANAIEFLTRAGIRAAEWFGIGTAAESAGSTAAAVEEMITGEDTGTSRAATTIASTILAGKTVGPAFRKLEDKANALMQNARISNITSKKKLEDASQAFAYANTKSILKEIAKGEKKDVETIMKDFKQISHYFNDVDIPFFIATSDNPVVKGQLNKLIRNNPAVRTKVNEELDKIYKAIENKSDQLFGAKLSGDSLLEKIPTANVRQSLQNRLTGLKIASDNLTTKIDELGYSLAPTKTAEQRGVEITKLVDQRLKDAREIRTLEYADILGKAKQDKAVMPEKGVRQIWQYVKSTGLDDLFGAGTSVEAKIKRFLQPTTTRVIKDNKAVITKKFPELTFSQVDSLKRSINKKLREVKDPTTIDRLTELKKIVNKARNTIPGPYNAALKLADSNYYKNIGIPFGTQGIREISSKKYANQVAPIIVKDSEQLQQFLDVVGTAKGTEIARNALLAEVHKKAVINGEVKPAIVRKIMKDKKDVVKLIPGLEQELENAAKYQGYLTTRKANIDSVVREQERKIGEHFLIKAGGVEGYQPSKVVTKMLENRDYMTNILSDIKKLDPKVKTPVINTLRRQFVTHISDHPEGAVKWLSNAENKYAVDKIMGEGYQDGIKAFARLSDKLKSVQPDKVANMPTGAVYDWVKQKSGVDLASVVATLRRPIVSPFQKAVILASRVWTGGRATSADKKLEEVFFSDIDGIAKFAKLENDYKIKTKMDAMSLLKDYTDLAGEIAPTFIYSGLKNAAIGEESSQKLEQYQEEVLNSIR